MHAPLSTLALGLVALTGLTQATMIPNAALHFTLPPKGQTIQGTNTTATATTTEKRTMIPNSVLGFKLPAPESKAIERRGDEDARDVPSVIPPAKSERHTVVPSAYLEDRSYEKRTMIPNSMLGFVLPKAEASAKVTEKRDEEARDVPSVIPPAKTERHTVVPSAYLQARSSYEKRTMIPNSVLGFVLPKAAVAEKREEARDIPSVVPAAKYERHTMVPNEYLGFEVPAPAQETKREEVSRPYEKRTMIPNSMLGFVLPSEAKLASRSAAWKQVVKA